MRDRAHTRGSTGNRGFEMGAITYPQADGLFKNPAYSHVAVASGGRTAYISGQVAVGRQGKLAGAGDPPPPMARGIFFLLFW